MSSPERHFDLQDQMEPEVQEERASRWFLLERGSNQVHFDQPIEGHMLGKVIVAPLPVLIQVRYPGKPGKVCTIYYEVLTEFYELLFGEPFVEGDRILNTCPHMGHFVELEEVVHG